MTNPITAIWPGRPYPRGACWDGEGVNFAIFSEHAEKVELCLFDAKGKSEVQRIELKERSDLVCTTPRRIFASWSSSAAARGMRLIW